MYVIKQFPVPLCDEAYAQCARAQNSSRVELASSPWIPAHMQMPYPLRRYPASGCKGITIENGKASRKSWENAGCVTNLTI